MDVPGGGHEEDHVDGQAGRRPDEWSDPEEGSQPDRDLRHPDQDPGDRGDVPEHREQRMKGTALPERAQLFPDVCGCTRVQEVRIGELLDPGVEERAAEERAQDPDGPCLACPTRPDREGRTVRCSTTPSIRARRCDGV